MLVKPKRVIDRRYREWIKNLPCLLSSMGCIQPIDPHHVIPKGEGRMGSKVSDRRCVPLCRRHHEIVEANPNGYRETCEHAITRLNAEYEYAMPPTAKRERPRKPNLKVGLQVKGCPECRGEHFFPISKSSMFEIGAAGIVGFMCLTKRKWVAA